MKLRNQTFVWTANVRNVMKLLKCVLSRVARLKTVRSFGTLRKSHKPFETAMKMKVAKQVTTKIKTNFLTVSGSEISFVVTAIVPKNEKDYYVND